MTTFSISNLGKPSPSGYRIFMNIMVIAVIPTFVTVVEAWGFSDKVVHHFLLISTAITTIITGIGGFLGVSPGPDPSPNQSTKN